MRTCALAVLVFYCLFLLSCNQTNTKEKQVVNAVADSPANLDAVVNADLIIDSFFQNYEHAYAQHFEVKAGRKKMLVTKGGLKILVEPSKLVSLTGNTVSDDIHVEVMELYKPTDFMNANAATVSNGKLLVSGGSFHIRMSSAGEELKIRDGNVLSMDFPRKSGEEMQIFYGRREDNTGMNWIPTSIFLMPVKEDINFSSGFGNTWFPNRLDTSTGYLFRDMNAHLYFRNRVWSLKEYLDTMNANGVKLVVNRISFWPRDLPTDRVLDTNYLTYLYGPRFQYTVTSDRRHDSLMQELAKRKTEDSLARISEDKGNLAQKLGAYYETTGISQLGWINIDRFYKESSPCEPEFEFPIAVKDSRLHYFLLFRKINSMMNGVAAIDGLVAKLGSLPKGQTVSLLGFAAKNGKIYKTEKTFEIGKSSLESLSFEPVSRDELQKTFGKNVSFSN